MQHLRRLSYQYRVGQKSTPLRLTDYIFKTYWPICVIFGTLQHCFVLNTSVNFILNKFIIPVAPLNDNINNSVFHLQSQARPLHSNAHVFKIPAPICTVFGTIEYRNILNTRRHSGSAYIRQVLKTGLITVTDREIKVKTVYQPVWLRSHGGYNERYVIFINCLIQETPPGERQKLVIQLL